MRCCSLCGAAGSHSHFVLRCFRGLRKRWACLSRRAPRPRRCPAREQPQPTRARAKRRLRSGVVTWHHPAVQPRAALSTSPERCMSRMDPTPTPEHDDDYGYDRCHTNGAPVGKARRRFVNRGPPHSRALPPSFFLPRACGPPLAARLVRARQWCAPVRSSCTCASAASSSWSWSTARAWRTWKASSPCRACRTRCSRAKPTRGARSLPRHAMLLRVSLRVRCASLSRPALKRSATAPRLLPQEWPVTPYTLKITNHSADMAYAKIYCDGFQACSQYLSPGENEVKGFKDSTGRRACCAGVGGAVRVAPPRTDTPDGPSQERGLPGVPVVAAAAREQGQGREPGASVQRRRKGARSGGRGVRLACAALTQAHGGCCRPRRR